MPKLAAPSFKIVPFQNPSGATVFRLTGTTLAGQRVRINYPSRAEAEAELGKRLGVGRAAGPQFILTTLTELTVREAEAATRLLPPDTNLVQAADFFHRHFRPLKPLELQPKKAPLGTPAVRYSGADAVSQYHLHLLDERENEAVTADQAQTVLLGFARFATEQVPPVTRSDRITVNLARRWIFGTDEDGQPIEGFPELSARTKRDRYDLLNRFCAWLVLRNRLLENPVAELIRPKVRVGVPAVFNFAQIWTLLHEALTDGEGPHTLPFFATCSLSGVRPDEYERLEPGDFYLDAEHPFIELNKAKGGIARRNVELSEPLVRILKECIARGIALGGKVSKRKFDRVRRTAGLYEGWVSDILRHTYASHEYVRTRDIKSLTANMGNSERVLFANYIRAGVPKLDAEKFRGLILHWSATPHPSKAPKKKESAAAINRG